MSMQATAMPGRRGRGAMLLLCVCLGLVLAGCDNGGVELRPEQTTISGRAVAGPFVSGTVKAFRTSDTGQKSTAPNALLAQARTDANGKYELVVFDRFYKGPVLIEVTGKYLDESKSSSENGGMSDTGATPLVALAPSFAPGKPLTAVQVTPLSLIAARLAQRLGSSAGRLTEAHVFDANRQAALAFGLSGLAASGGAAVAAADPVDAARGSGSGDRLKYGILLAGLAQLSKESGVDPALLVETIAADFAADGLLDGTIGQQQVMLVSTRGASVPYTAGLVTSGLVTSVNNFLGSSNNRTGVSGGGDDRISGTLSELSAPLPPSASITASTTRAAIGEVVRLDGSASSSSRAGVVLNYRWKVTLNGVPIPNSKSDGPVTTFKITSIGSYFCDLEVDDGRLKRKVTQRVEVGTTTLLIESLALTPSPVIAGATTTAVVSVRNTGPATAGLVAPVLFLSRGTAGTPPEFSAPEISSITPTSVIPGGLVTFRLPIATRSSAGLGPLTVAVKAIGINTDFSPLVSQVVNILPDRLTLEPFSPSPLSVARGGKFALTIPVKNSSSSPTASGVNAALTGSGFTSVLRPPPATVPVGTAATNFIFDVTAGLVDGAFDITATVFATINGTDVTGTLVSSRYLTVTPPAPLSLVSLNPSNLTTAQGGRFPASVVWLNPNPLPTGAGVTASLGGTNLTAAASGTNPQAIAAGATATFNFDVTANGAVGTTDAVFGIAGTVAGGTVDSTQPVLNFLRVNSPQLLSFVSVAPSTVSTAQGNRTSATVRFSNPNQLAFSVTGAVALTGTGFTAALRPGFPASIAPGATGAFGFDVTAGATAGTFDARASIVGNVAGAGNSGSRNLTSFLQVTPALPLVIESLTPTPVTTPQGGKRQVTVRIRNPNGLPTSIGLTATLTGTGFTATAFPGNPSSIGASASSDYHFDLIAGGTVGLFDARASVQGALSGTNVGAAALFAGAVSVISATRLSFVSLTPSSVTTVQGGRFIATARFRNGNGLATSADATSSLTGSGFTATVRPGNSTSIAAGGIGTFAFDVTASLATGTFAARASVSNSLGGSDVSTGQTVSGFLVTGPRPILAIAAVTPARSTVSTGQTTRVDLVVRNNGAAAANLPSAPVLAFRQGGTLVTSQFTSFQTPAVTVIPANTTVTIPFDVTPGSGATAFGALTLGASVSALSAVQASLDASVTSTAAGSWTLTRAVTAGNIGGTLTAPAGIDRGGATPVEVRVSLQSSNSNDATFTATSQSLLFQNGATVVSGQYLVTLAPGLTFPFNLAAGTSRIVTYQVNALGSATKAASITITANIRGRDANSGVAVDITRSGSWVVRDAATTVLGQADFAGAAPGTAELTLKQPSAFLVDAGKLFVADQGNHRVIRYDSIAPTGPATVVFGQATFTAGLANRGTGPGLGGMSSPASLAATTVLGRHRLYVGDQGNNRVLVFDDVDRTQTGDPATYVIGQPSIGAVSANRGLTTAGPDRFSLPGGLVVTGSRLIVADTGNNRVLVFPAIQSVNAATAATYAAAFAFGQAKLSGAAAAAVTSDGSLAAPVGLACFGTRLVVADTGASRVLIFDNLPGRSTNGTAANVVLGQANFTGNLPATAAGRTALPQGVWVNRNRLYIADTGNNRVLVYSNFGGLTGADNGRAADDLVGQALFTQSAANNTVAGAVDAFSLSGPSSVFSDGVASDAVRVLDRINNRILLVPLP